MNTDTLIGKYQRYQERRGLSWNTVEKRTRSLKMFAEQVGFDATREQIEDWLDSRGLAAKSRAVWISHLGVFFRWAVSEGLLPSDPTVRIKAPKLRRNLPRPIPDAQLTKALKAATPLLRSWLLLGAFAGLRCQEIAGLAREDVLDREGLLRVTQGKGGKERLVPLHGDVLAALKDYGMATEGPLFRGRGGERVTPGALSHRLGDYLRGLGITSTPHSLRHFFGTRLLQQSHDLRLVQDAMGHQNISSTAIYTGVDQAATRVAVSALRVSA
jgi:site-specific recombinase XerD